MPELRLRAVLALAGVAACCVLLALATLGPVRASAAPPPNDNFTNAQVVGPAVPIAVDATTVEATAEPDEPPHCCNPASHSVWYSWTPAVSIEAVVDVCDKDPAIGFTTEAVYMGSALNALTPVASTAGECILHFAATGGQNYKIAIDHNEEVGAFTLRLRQLTPPANDNFANAETIGPSLPITISRSNVDSTTEANEPAAHGGGAGRSVWFTWTAPANVTVRLDMCDFQTRTGAGNHGVFVYTGSTLTTLVAVFSSAFQCKTTFDAVSGTTYRIAFSATFGGEGTFTLKLLQAVPPPNDDFNSAIPVGPSLPVALPDDTIFATVEPDEPNHGEYPGNTLFPPHDSVWYTWTAPANVQARIQVCESDFAARLGVYTGNAVNTLTKVTPAAPINSQPFCSVRFNAVMGTTYRIAVGGGPEDDTEGNFLLDIHVFTPPPNDDFANAQQLSAALPISVSGSTIDAGAETGEPNHGEEFGAERSVWYRWTPSAGGPVGIDACTTSDFNTLIGVHTGTALNALIRVATSESGPGCEAHPFGGKLTMNVTAGTTYFIAVDGGEGHFTLGLSSLNPPVVPVPATPGFNLKAALKRCKQKFPKGQKRKKCIKKAKKRAKREGQTG
jgi:hypothetical protein